LAGAAVPSQRLADGRLAVWLDTVPALGSLRLTVGPGEPEPPRRAVTLGEAALDNGAVQVALDPTSGAVTGLRSRAAGDRNLIAAGPGLLGYLYVAGVDPSRAIGNGQARIGAVDAGPLVATLSIESDAPGGRRLSRTVQLVAGSDEVSLTAVLDKIAVREKESAHLAFPFAIPGGTVRVDEGEALVEPGIAQLPGSCRDFMCAQSAADVSGAVFGVSLVTLDSPLLELGAVTDEKLVNGAVRAWPERVVPGTTLYAYLLNNYWHTNYKADQQGLITARFALRPHGAFDAAALWRLSGEHDQPLLVFPVDSASPPPRAPFSLESAAVVVSALRPIDGGRALLLRLYNPSPRPAGATLHLTATTAHLFASSETGEARSPVASTLELPAYGVRVLKLLLSP
jgi:hypothetical protein